MSNCQKTLQDLYPYLDGELSEEVHAHIGVHLEACTDCLEAFDFEAELKAAIRRKASNDELPTGLIARLEDCLQTDLHADRRQLDDEDSNNLAS